MNSKTLLSLFILFTFSLPNGAQWRKKISRWLILAFGAVAGLQGGAAFSQQWQPMDKGVNLAVRALFADTVENTIYAGGDFTTGGPGNPYSYPLVLIRWNDTLLKWDSIKKPYGSFIESITKFKNKLIVGGNSSFLFMYDGSNWDSVKVGDNSIYNAGTVWGMYNYNDDSLYVLGIFDSINHIPFTNISIFDGINWSPLPLLDGFSINDAIMYKGKLYVGGNFDDAGADKHDIARFNFLTNQWETVGGGTTCDCIINKLYIYRDTLIVAGYFQSLGGQPFNNIAAWDGNNWIDMDGGVMPSNVFDVIEYDNKLYASGQISSLPDNTPINRMAKWDGQQWSDAGFNFNGGTPLALAVLNNSLYIAGGFKTFNGDTVNNIVKYTAPQAPAVEFIADSVNTCQGFVNFTDLSLNSPVSWLWDFGDGGTSTQKTPSYYYLNNGVYTVNLTATNSVGSNTKTKIDYIAKNNVFCDGNGEEEFQVSDFGFQIYPNPANGSITITAKDGNEIIITDITGRKIKTIQNFKNTINLSTHEFTNGIYFLSLYNKSSIISIQKFVIIK